MKHRRAPLIRFLARKCARFIEHYENASNYDFDHNGELFVLEALAPHKFTCIFDVGANVGEWTLMAHDIFPEATIHCFEVMHSTFELLCKNTSHIEKIIRNDFGLLDKDSEVELKYFPAVNALTTLTDYPHNFPHQSAHGRVIPGDAYVAKCDASINFLKIDVEGVEGLVLAGFADTLMNHRVDVV